MKKLLSIIALLFITSIAHAAYTPGYEVSGGANIAERDQNNIPVGYLLNQF
jgi:hypothetical protein